MPLPHKEQKLSSEQSISGAGWKKYGTRNDNTHTNKKGRMKTEDQIKSIAELDGWLDVKVYSFSYNYAGEKGTLEQLQGREPKDLGTLKSPPPYLTSRDAIIGVINKQPTAIKAEVNRLLIMWHQFGWSWDNEVEKFGEALLRATGKWI